MILLLYVKQTYLWSSQFLVPSVDLVLWKHKDSNKNFSVAWTLNLGNNYVWE